MVDATGQIRRQSFRDLPFARSPLNWAALRGNVDLIQRLLDAGIPVDVRAPAIQYTNTSGYQRAARDSRGLTPLFLAVKSGHTSAVGLLIDSGADVNATCSDGHFDITPLVQGGRNGDCEMISALLRNGAEVDDLGDWTYIMPSLDDELVLEKLILSINPKHIRGRAGASALTAAANANNRKLAELLEKHGAKVDIHCAVILGHTSRFKELATTLPTLLKASLPGGVGERPLDLAIRHGRAEIVRHLLNNGVEASPSNPWDSTLIHQAVQHGHWELVECLLEFGFTLSDRDNNGATLVHTAAAGCQPRILERLLRKGLDPRALDFSKRTPLHSLGSFTIGRESSEDIRDRADQCAELLLSAGVDIHARTSHQESALHQAADMGLVEVAKKLLERGAKVNARNWRNETPLKKTASSSLSSTIFGVNQIEVRRLLQSRGGTE